MQALNKFQDESGGPLLGGDPGIRLIETPGDPPPEYFSKIPKHTGHKSGEWTVVPLYHIYGSEELSMLSPAIAELAPQPYLALNSEDIKHLKIAEGERVALIGKIESLDLPVRSMDSLPKGVAGLPHGLLGMKWFDYSERCRIVRV